MQLALFRDCAGNRTLHPRLQEWFRTSQVPLLAVWGADDEIFGPEGARASTRDLPQAQVHLLDAGHSALESDSRASQSPSWTSWRAPRSDPDRHPTRAHRHRVALRGPCIRAASRRMPETHVLGLDRRSNRSGPPRTTSQVSWTTSSATASPGAWARTIPPPGGLVATSGGAMSSRTLLTGADRDADGLAAAAAEDHAVVMSINTTRVRVSAERDWYEPYAISLGIRVGNLVFVSGQAAVDEHGRSVGGDDFEAQARQVFANLATVLGNAGSGLEHVVKVTVLVTDMAVIDQVVALRREFFTEPYPADTIAQVAALAQPEWQIEIEAVAVVPDHS